MTIDLTQPYLTFTSDKSPAEAAHIFHNVFGSWPQEIIYPVGAVIPPTEREIAKDLNIIVTTSAQAKGLCHVGPIFAQYRARSARRRRYESTAL